MIGLDLVKPGSWKRLDLRVRAGALAAALARATCRSSVGSGGRRRAGAALLIAVLISGPSFSNEAPPNTPSKKVVFLAQDLRNGGIVAAFRSFQEAAKEVGWAVSLVNLQGNTQMLRTRFTELAAGKFDAIVLGGADERAVADLATLLDHPGKPRTVVVGWHASDKPGPGQLVFTNVTTDPALVAEMAVSYLVRTALDHAGVVLFNDSRFAIANYKTQHMIDALQHCKVCEVLAVEDIPISEAGERMAGTIKRLQSRWGKRWTHVLAINDVYLDSINFPEALIGRADLVGVAAGDGSRTALTRIRTGRSKQAATVAEPVGLQGWQLVDELIRAFSGEPPSGSVGKPVLVTAEMLRDRPDWDLQLGAGEQEAFRRRWHDRH
ncbi:substrate-binding domain-containing protein [Roseateles saccharophilus]|uniref:Monosaccharide ABC transporter substrate-binding protein (CUT2 family) n=1 Tax=Roseateles saccharophilus TaxID=304 RepID=A0A4R3UN17_ROSSA|nr:substrate-binding domain-containing protein [Roseateles saccharophilus]TCU93106.1 monosaccharide ABC transporter substrate-binding protein (CUT2 family) [Roseateles saccharophilus]